MELIDKSQPLIVAIIIGMQDNKLLMHQRKTEPFYDTWGFPGGKVRVGETMQECAEREFREETGLTGKFELKAINEMRTFNNEKFERHHHHFIFSATEISGKLIDTFEGPNLWMDEDEIANLDKIYPDVPLLIEIAKGKEFRLLECNRYQKDGEFVNLKVMSDRILKTALS